MARKADPDLDRRRKKSGERLAEGIERKKLQSKQFLSIMKEKYGEKDECSEDGFYLPGLNSESALSKVINGHATLQNKHAIMAADILGMDVNYLLGTIDNFREPSYDAYLAFWGETTQDQEDELNKFINMLRPLGYSYFSMTARDDEILEYSLSNKTDRADIPAAEIDALYKDINDYIRLSVDRLIKKYKRTDDVKEK